MQSEGGGAQSLQILFKGTAISPKISSLTTGRTACDGGYLAAAPLQEDSCISRKSKARGIL